MSFTLCLPNLYIRLYSAIGRVLAIRVLLYCLYKRTVIHSATQADFSGQTVYYPKPKSKDNYSLVDVELSMSSSLSL